MYKITIPLFLLLIFPLVACQTRSMKGKLAELAEDYYQERLPLFPLDATKAGDSRYNDRFPNTISEAYEQELDSFYRKYQKRLAAIDRDALGEEDRITYDVLQLECANALSELAFPGELMPIDQMWSVNLYMGQLAGGTGAQPFGTVKDYADWLKRVDGYIVWCDTAIANMRKGIETGYVLPAALIEKVIPQIAAFAHGPVEKHPFYQPVTLFPESFSAAEKEQITVEYADMVQNKIIPVYRRLEAFLKETYLPAGRASSGYADLPNGPAWYRQRVRTFTTLDMSADEIHKLGLAEVDRLSREMNEVKKQVGFEGDLLAFFDFVRSNKALMPFTEPQQVIDHFNAIHERIKPSLLRLFNKVPKTPFEVRRTEAFREKSASAEYNEGSLDGTRPGIFYVPIPDVTRYNTFSDEDLFLHEAIPGHHYQISLQQENTELPQFRKTLWYSAYGEGWALYCESLGRELGLFEDPFQYFGMLSSEMHRAIRLVVDTGIHAKGWTREQAIQYSLEHEAESRESAVSEIERYMANPGQALSYKIGQLKILELRARAEQKLGDRFDIRAFHDKVLESGCLPLKVLEAKIDRWIAQQSPDKP